MNREDLIKTALDLKGFESFAIDEYSLKKDILVVKINKKMIARLDIKEIIGENNIEMMKDNHANHARFVENILRNYNAVILVDTVSWVFRAYRSRGFHPNYWAAQLNGWIDILKEELSKESFNVIYPLYNWFTVNIPAFTNLSESL
ncbi:MAG: hypothetical protein HQK76_16745 [Desulfobacterales bacterium]|nr:hypothetical protein [Desulfobacterales bacterium]